MLRTIKRATKNELLRNNVVFFAGSIAVGGLNYILYPLLSRIVSVREFGEVQVIINLLIQFTILTNIVSLFVVNIATNLESMPDIRKFIANLEGLAISFGAVFAAIVCLASPWLASLLQYNTIVPFIIIGLIMVINVPLSVRIGFLRSQKAFAYASLAQISQSIFRLICISLAAVLGLGVSGMVGGLALSLVLSGIYSIWLANKQGLKIYPLDSLRSPSLSRFLTQLQSLRGTLRYMLLVTITSFGIIFLLSIDTFTSKRFFTPEQAGLYGALSVVASIIFYSSGSIAGVLASSVKVTSTRKESLRLLLYSCALVFVSGGVVTLLYSMYSETFVRILVGNQFVANAFLLPKLAAAVFCISLINVIIIYHVAKRDIYIGAVTLIGIVTTGIFLLLNHSDTAQLISSYLSGAVTMLVMMILWSVYWHIVKRGGSNRQPHA